jgi:hypothetical protein
MLTKHKILEVLYQVQIVNKDENITLIDVSLNLDTLKKRIKAKEQDFQSSLEVLNANGEIFVYWTENLVTITRDGIVSLGNKRYFNEYIKLRREKIYFWIKITGAISIVITLILGIIQIIHYFTPPK